MSIAVSLSRLLSFCCILSIAFLANPLSVQAGFGVSPGMFEETNLVPGAVLERTVYLVQGDPSVPLAVHVEVESAEIADWITVKQGSDLTIPAGVQQFPLTLVMTVPEDAPLGIYKAALRINTLPAQVEGAQVTVALGGVVGLTLHVGDNLLSEFSIRSIDIHDVREGEKPLATVIVTNTGNVPAAPESASFELFNKYGNIRLAYGENNAFTKVPAFQEGASTLEFPLDVRLAVGEYWGHVKVYDDGKVIKELRTVFNVTEKTFIEKYLYAGIAALSVLVLALLAWGIRRRKRRS